ncbi:hypothetical protein Prudu_016350 [Prunus dulcis]|uniref:Serine carboxypeptidase S28 family protein n=1 Tax=Prunus dulcis TaxID=3755 RepID=A0A4Y1RLT2_PRUDU|nr:hypothetical protein Prudu_016350 [Prunus dulcis]
MLTNPKINPNRCRVEMAGISNDSMFPANQFDLNDHIEWCRNSMASLLGLIGPLLTLEAMFASNIIFSNGLRDPYSSGGVLENISDTVVAVHTKNGSHCLDIVGANTTDPDWLVNQRKVEVKIIKGWLDKYYASAGIFK